MSCPPVMFVLDTNILVTWMDALSGKSGREREAERQMKLFCDRTPHPVYVPDLVWLELIALKVQKNIPMDTDYHGTLRHFRDAQTRMQQLEEGIRSRLWHFSWQPPASATLLQQATEIMQDRNLLTTKIFSWMQKRAKKPYHKGDVAKLLDGLDSAILLYTHALAEQHPETQVILYTADYPLFLVASQAFRNYSWFAGNARAIFARFEKIPCAVCGYENPVSALYGPGMYCRNAKALPHVLWAE